MLKKSAFQSKKKQTKVKGIFSIFKYIQTVNFLA